jgi:hypothetical protein
MRTVAFFAFAVAALSTSAFAGCGGATVSVGNQDGGPGGSAVDGSGGDPDGGGGTCMPLPGCSSTTTCPAGDGCNTCECFNGAWGCTLIACLEDAGPAVCPPTLPHSGTACTSEGLRCPQVPGCGGPWCTCTGGAWQCVFPKCPAPVCPTNAPQNGTICSPAVGQQCTYPINGVCTEYLCTCSPSGTWSCTDSGCIDAGAPDAGPG